MILFIDTETNGLRYKDELPRLTAVAWVVQDNKRDVISEKGFLIKPMNFEISEAAEKVTGISQNIALEYGNNISDILVCLNQTIDQCHQIVSLNLDFDMEIIKNEFTLLNLNASGIDKLIPIDLFDHFSTTELIKPKKSIEDTSLKRTVNFYWEAVQQGKVQPLDVIEKGV